MSVRTRAATPELRGIPVAKTYGTSVPESFRQGEIAAQMTPASPFSPGQPLGPYDGFDRTPRAFDFTTARNIATRPRTHERVSFETLTGLIDNYDVAQIAINHRIDSVRSLDWQLVAADGTEGDVSHAIALGMAALDKPDRINCFETWLGKWLWDELAYGCGPLYRLRNRAGRCIGLMPVDVRTIAPLLDYWGNPPGAMLAEGEPLPESHVQFANGIPWNWLTLRDLIYEPFRLHNDSPYGRAPIESVILNANTDIRFQLYFLQRFTDGNLPAAFAGAPESWTPDQIEQFQEYWDSFMTGDQSRKHQIRWIPGGSSFAWSDEKDFTDTFSLFLMRKTAAAFHVVPADLGFTENVNRSSGESQADVQHRVGDLPFIRYIQRILTGFLRRDLGLPLKFTFDLGEEQVDRVQQAQADKIYVDMGAVSPSYIGEMRYGTTDPVIIPRYIFTERAGPIPVASLMAVAGEIDQATGLPALGAVLPETVFGGTEGVLPNPPIRVMSLAEQEFGPGAMPPAPPPQPKMQPADATDPVAKEGETAGITAETGITSYDLIRDDDEDEPEAVAKRFLTIAEAREMGREVREQEMSAFRRFCRARRKAGQWRDFTFEHHSPAEARELNRSGMVGVAKAAGEVAVAGLAVLAADTGRVLMLQRALSDDDPAAGKIEFPGGHLENGESALSGAWREWAEETGSVPPPGTVTGEWTSADGVYRGIVWTAESETAVPVRGGSVVPNPDDPDGDQAEAIMWVDPADLAGNPMVRDELAASLPDVLPLLGCAPVDPADAEIAKAYPDGQSYGSHAFRPTAGWPRICHYCGVGESDPMHDAYRDVAKAAMSGPKAWPGWKIDLRTADHWAPVAAAAARKALPGAGLHAMAEDYLEANPDQQGDEPGKRDRNHAAAAWVLEWLAARGISLGLGPAAQGIAADSYMAGAASAHAAVNGSEDAETAGWTPGDTAAATAVTASLGAGAALDAILSGDGEGTAAAAGEALEGGFSGSLAVILAGYDAEESAAVLGDLLDAAAESGDWAVSPVLTQVTTFAGQAAMDYYLANTTSLLQWVDAGDARVCPACLRNAAAEPRHAGEAWPAGATEPPQHPGGCRCALVPVG